MARWKWFGCITNKPKAVNGIGAFVVDNILSEEWYENVCKKTENESTAQGQNWNVKLTLPNRFAKRLDGMCPRNGVLILQTKPIAKAKKKTCTRNYFKVISRQVIFAWKCHANSNKKNQSKHTFMPSMTNKCNVMPNMYSLNHCHALRADSTKRDDFSETGTK